jgi:hypothetical protein
MVGSTGLRSVDCANQRCWKALVVGGVGWMIGRSSNFKCEPLSMGMRSLPMLRGLAGGEQACRRFGDSRHFCRHAAHHGLRGLSPVSPLSPREENLCPILIRLW